MTTASTIVAAAYRELNVIPVGTSPTTSELTEGLAVLNGVLAATFGFLIGAPLREWPIPCLQRTGDVTREWPMLPGANATLLPKFTNYPPCGSRIVWDGSPQTVYLPDSPQDGARISVVQGSGADGAALGTLTVDGNGRHVEDADTYTFDATTGTLVARDWFYRADLANWIRITPLALTDELPFPADLDDYSVCGTAIRVSGRFGKTVPPATAQRSQEMTRVLRTRYFQSGAQDGGGRLLRQTYQSYPNTTTWMR